MLFANWRVFRRRTMRPASCAASYVRDSRISLSNYISKCRFVLLVFFLSSFLANVTFSQSTGSYSANSSPVRTPGAMPSSVTTSAPPAVQTESAQAQAKNQITYSSILFGLLALLALSMVVWFLFVFTTDLTSDANEAKTQIALKRMILFCYVFTFITLMVAALPFVITLLPPNTVRNLYAEMVESPVALGLGCVRQHIRPEDSHWEVVCREDQFADQWLINIGGYTLAAPPEDIVPGIDNHITGLVYSFPRMIIHGGITVPFYFVFISLLGAAVSMTRKIPEYQSRLLNQNDPLEPPEARQKMVFQILQFISAPFIAITAYVMITPASPTSSVAIAFVSGFSSEIILRGISYFSNRFEEFVSRQTVPPSKDAKKDVEAKARAEP